MTLKYGAYCKMYGIDASHWTDLESQGNIPKWMGYHGTILVVSGVIGMLAVGPLADALKAGPSFLRTDMRLILS